MSFKQVSSKQMSFELWTNVFKTNIYWHNASTLTYTIITIEKGTNTNFLFEQSPLELIIKLEQIPFEQKFLD